MKKTSTGQHRFSLRSVFALRTLILRELIQHNSSKSLQRVFIMRLSQTYALIAYTLLAIVPGILAADAKPNIVVILCDDVGYSDLGCYGGEIRTPNLDALANGGLRFTQFYNTGRCCPTRASLLTGLYPHQASIGHMMEDKKLPGYRGNLGRDCVTIAEALKSAGYRNYMAGKWHVTPLPKGERMVNADKTNWPLQRGFDRFYGTIHGAGSFWDPNSLVRDNQFVSPFADPQYPTKEFYYTDAISDHACRFVNEHDQDNPFFMYVAYTAAHWPMHARESDIDKYKGMYDAGYASVRQARYKRMLELGVIDPSAKLSPQDAEWSDVTNEAWEIRCMETYAAMMTVMDEGIGRIVETLKTTKQFDNTLILFMQDNGGCAEGMGRRPTKDKSRLVRADVAPLASMPAAAFQTDMIPKQTRDGFPVRQGYGVMPGPADTYIGYGKGWANVSNTPFRRYKHYVHEGGISTPLIAHWPKGISAAGELRHTPSHLIDIIATCVDFGGATYPDTFAEHEIQPMEGTSLRTVFAKDELDARHLFFEHEGNGALRIGDWKLVGTKVINKNDTKRAKRELYNIAEDRSELNDLSKEMPELFEQMVGMYEEEAERLRVFPAPVK